MSPLPCPQRLLQKSLPSKADPVVGVIGSGIEPFGIAFSADYSLIPGMKPAPFRLERRAGLGFDTNLYVSQAPLRTADHIKLLEQLEKLAE
jgi:hypothetical protein